MKNRTFKIFYNFVTTHSDKGRLRWVGDKVKVGNLLSNSNYISIHWTDLCGCISLGQYGLELFTLGWRSVEMNQMPLQQASLSLSGVNKRSFSLLN